MCKLYSKCGLSLKSNEMYFLQSLLLEVGLRYSCLTISGIEAKHTFSGANIINYLLLTRMIKRNNCVNTFYNLV